MTRYSVTSYAVAALALSLVFLGCESPNLPATTVGGGFLGATFIQYLPAPRVAFPLQTVHGSWQNDCTTGRISPAGSATSWTTTSNFEAAFMVVNGRTCATWNIGYLSGPCADLAGNINIPASAPYAITVGLVCQVTEEGVPIIGSGPGDGGDPGIAFAPNPIFNENPTPGTTVAAYTTGPGFTSTYGMPLFQWFDASGTLRAQEYATSVSPTSLGTVAVGPMPAALNTVGPGVYIGLAKNASAANTYSVLGIGAITVVQGTGQDGGGNGGCPTGHKVC
jgi:hypothetical protein